MKRIFIIIQTTFQDCRVHFALFSDNLSQNSCIFVAAHVVVDFIVSLWYNLSSKLDGIAIEKSNRATLTYLPISLTTLYLPTYHIS